MLRQDPSGSVRLAPGPQTADRALASRATRAILAVTFAATALLVLTLALPASTLAATTRITFTMQTGDQKEVANYQDLIDKFQVAHPDIKVEFVQLSGNYYEKIPTMLATNTAPDLFWYGGQNSAQFIRDGVLTDLTPFVAKSPSFNLADFFPSAVDPFRWQGGLYGIPRDVSPLVLYYNVDSFATAGLPSPNDYHDRQAWNWDNFLNVSRKLSAPNAATPRFGMATDWWWGLWFPWILTNGGDIFSPGYKEPVFDSPKARQGLQFLVDLIHVYHVVPSPEEADKLGGHWNLFVQGRAAMYPTGRWVVPGLRSLKDFNFDVVVMPYKERQATALFTGIYAIPKTSTKKEAAWQLLQWLVSPEAQLQLAADGQVVPSRASAAASSAFVHSTPPQHNLIFLEAAQHGYLEPVFPAFNKVGDATWGPFIDMFNGKITVNQALDTVMPLARQAMGLK
ncbi:MAG: sugar ABC transporter substrate-binding protein [Limnochordaceae bacterium]|nr:sugar ABC transporter substrate-binding protein [Limnochordaceae bacterium]